MDNRAWWTGINPNEVFQTRPFVAKQSLERLLVHVNLQVLDLILALPNEACGSLDVFLKIRVA